MRYALILAAVTVAVGASVLALLWVRDRLIDAWCDGFDYGLSDVTPADLDGPEPLPHREERHACPWCGARNTHYMTHVCPGCICWFTEVEIPGEPQLGSYLEGEWNPDCPIHSRLNSRSTP